MGSIVTCEGVVVVPIPDPCPRSFSLVLAEFPVRPSPDWLLLKGKTEQRLATAPSLPFFSCFFLTFFGRLLVDVGPQLQCR